MVSDAIYSFNCGIRYAAKNIMISLVSLIRMKSGLSHRVSICTVRKCTARLWSNFACGGEVGHA
jgi:hypothetical protein